MLDKSASTLMRESAQRDVVRLGGREEDERHPRAFDLDDPQVELQPAVSRSCTITKTQDS